MVETYAIEREREASSNEQEELELWLEPVLAL
jgi:hypothetical protein